MGWFTKKSDDPTGRPARPADAKAPATAEPKAPPRDFKPAPPRGVLPSDPLECALHQRRFGVFINAPAEWRKSPSYKPVTTKAVAAVDEGACLVPEGIASVSMRLNEEAGGPERDVTTAPFLLGRCAITNEDFQFFVDAGGYEDMDLWPREIWPQLIKFRDATGAFGPRFWREGVHDRRLSNHPVVGVCWYEALAYANWAGFRLPTEAEWQVAAGWQLAGTVSTSRRYPWGDALDLECCNIWASGHGHTLPVDACPAGAAPNGLLQLVGNTWEWTACDFQCADEKGAEILGEAPMKSIRGGAFDTYFAWQATATFRSAAPCLSRTPNIGFRIAMDLPPGN